MEPGTTHDPTIGSLLKGILDDVQTLFREEIALARVEIGEQATRAKAAAMSFGVAAGALLFGVTFLLIAAALGIADGLNWPVWAGFLTVAIVLTVGGAIAFAAARNRLHAVHVVPEETISTLKENSAWIAKRLSSEPR
jgi:hypothetical protein